MKRCISVILCVVLFTVSLAGCSPQLHERLLIRAVGVDRAENGWVITLRAASDGNGKEECFTARSDTVVRALEKASRDTGRKPLYSHNALLVFGRETAENGLKPCLDFFLRHYDSRPTVKVLLAEQTAQEVLFARDDKEELVPSGEIKALLNAEPFSGTAVDADLITLINSTYGTDSSAAIPMISVEDGKLSVKGTGILSDLQLQTVLEDTASRGYLLLNKRMHAGETVLHHEQCGIVTITTDGTRSSIRFTGTKENPRFAIRAEIGGEISSISNGLRHLESHVFPELEHLYAKAIEEEICAYLEETAKRQGLDGVGLERTLQRSNPKMWDAVHETLSDFLGKAEFDIEVHTQIKRTEEEDTPYL